MASRGKSRKIRKKNLKRKQKCSEETLCELSPGRGKESMVRSICETGGFQTGSEKVRELRMRRVVK